jgi:putative nucleotidyltransferase with HDIG domain
VSDQLLDGIPESARPHVADARVSEREGRLEQARASYERALRALRGSEHAPFAAALFRWIAWTHANQGDSDAALDCLEVAEATAEAAGDLRGLAAVLNTRAGTLFNLGELDQADVLFRRVRELAVRLKDRKLQAMADQNLGSVASIRGNLQDALGRFLVSLHSYEELSLEAYVGPLLSNIGRLQIDLGHDAEAERTFARAREQCRARGDTHHLMMVETNHARLMLRSDRVVPALKACEEARSLAETSRDERWLPQIHTVTGMAHARLGQPDVALGYMERAAELAGRRKDAKVLADVMLEQAGVLHSLGRNRESLQRLNDAHAIYRRMRARRELADVDLRLSALEDTFVKIVKSWGESIESKDPYTQGHSSRVAGIACQLATAYGLPADELIWFRMGALLHDVGKVAVPVEVLNKRGPLDDAEWKLMARHPVTGVELLDGIEFPWDVRPMIRHHHERWDGTGYPEKLAGDAIPLSARLLTIADVYDALTTDRPYRKGFAHGDALAIMLGDRGRSLDPALMNLFAEQVAPALQRAPVRAGPPSAARRGRAATLPTGFATTAAH